MRTEEELYDEATVFHPEMTHQLFGDRYVLKDVCMYVCRHVCVCVYAGMYVCMNICRCVYVPSVKGWGLEYLHCYCTKRVVKVN